MDFTHEALKMAGALATVLALLFGGLFILKRFMGEGQPNGGESILRLLGGLRLGQGKSLMLVEIAGEVLVLGTTTRELTLLTRVADGDRVEQLRSLSNRSLGRIGFWPAGFRSRMTEDHTLGSQEQGQNQNPSS